MNRQFSVEEDAVLFPYAITDAGDKYFAFAAANTDHIPHFVVRGDNVFGYEDLPAPVSDLDYDDIMVKFSAI